MPSNEVVIAETKKWISNVVVGCNFCPFAAKEMKRGTVHYEVVRTGVRNKKLKQLTSAFLQLNLDKTIETTLLIFPESFRSFDSFLQLIANAEADLKKSGYEGVYQLASFHPDYLFEGAADDDPANYTNRSLYPMLQLLRESSLTIAIDNHRDPEGIPQRNISFARKKGLAHMQVLREACFTF
ncbi:MAG TPA: DUF1415 domain-containing protein [Chitinophagales bacterium]|nr:DUF1415 domain-containing protein [Chitinophagales bacterium]